MTPSFSFADVLAAPFPSDLRVAPDGAHAAWVVNDGGCRNLWVAPTMHDGPARALSAYLGDDGIAIGQLCWSAAADAIFYTRGAGLDDDTLPDPDGLAGADAAPCIWRAGLDRQPPRVLAAGHSPAAAPVGGLLAYIRDGRVWGLHLDDVAQTACWAPQATRCSGLTWSPDGARLAFVSAYDDRTAIGVLDIASMAVHWLATGAQFDSAPAWSPDGGALAFIRQLDDPAPTYMARPAGTPWSVWTADIASGAVRCAWRGGEGAGSVFVALQTGPQLLWTRCGSLVFPWEGSGWLHLYAVAAEAQGAEGTMGRALTPGPGEIFAMHDDAVAGAIVCVANRDQRDGRRLWRCALAGGRMSPLSTSAVVTDLPSVAGGVIVAIQSDGRVPPRPVVIKGRVLADAPLPARFPAASLAAPQSVSFAAADGLPVHAQLFVPTPRTDGSCHPAIVHCHGGPARQMLPAWHPSEVYAKQYGMNLYLASLGYLVLSLNYRGGTGYGLAFREPPGFGAGGASEYQDVLAAAHFLRRRGDIDPQRIGIYGTSYGGLLTALALARDSGADDGLFAAGVDCAGVADWTPAFAGAAVPEAARRIAIAASPLADVARWRAPVLLMHASADSVVPPAQTDVLARALQDKGDVDVEYIVFAGESHDLLRHASWLRYGAASAAWFEQHMAQRDDNRAAAAIAVPTLEEPV